jgi:hypothetical protein
MAYKSSAPGSSIDPSFCATMPIGSPDSSTALTIASVFGLPTEIGMMLPGKKTELRKGRIGISSPCPSPCPNR